MGAGGGGAGTQEQHNDGWFPHGHRLSPGLGAFSCSTRSRPPWSREPSSPVSDNAPGVQKDLPLAISNILPPIIMIPAGLFIAPDNTHAHTQSWKAWGTCAVFPNAVPLRVLLMTGCPWALSWLQSQTPQTRCFLSPQDKTCRCLAHSYLALLLKLNTLTHAQT